ncbi:putative max-interacting protein 1-like [Penaeus vannamei]|uniref:Putative max-interacting protein 1-like n=1 Tax=Penaeus vannamei TaxID=6689 RepID=A0A423U3U5_PENVA|nr:putative max-interacting protein 1-like [Penaeus vannamei]
MAGIISAPRRSRPSRARTEGSDWLPRPLSLFPSILSFHPVLPPPPVPLLLSCPPPTQSLSIRPSSPSIYPPPLSLSPLSLPLVVNLEDKDRKQTAHKNHLAREQRFLRRRLESLGTHLTPAGLDMAEVMGKRRSVSESSSLSSASTSSSSSGSSTSETGELLQDLSSVLGAPSSHNAETDEVDILGYGSNQSDTDDHSSIQSSASDGGVTISTRRLTITEPPSHAL